MDIYKLQFKGVIMTEKKNLFKRNTIKIEDLEEEDYKIKIRNHRIRILLVVLLVIAVITGITGYFRFSEKYKVYESGKVVDSLKREDADTVQYVSYANGVIKYSSDGACYIDGSLKVMWNITYEMQNPIYAISDNYVAIADKGGNEVFVCNTNGQVSDIDTLLPVQKLSISSTGVVAALLEDDGKSWIRMFNSAGSGTILAEVSVIMDQSGYPADFCISQDGIKLGITHLKISGGKLNTLAVFHNLDSVGQNKTDLLVSSKTFYDEIMPEMQYINDTTAVAVGTSEFDIFTGKQIPELTSQQGIKGEILRTFYSNKYIGMEIQNTESEEAYLINVYNTAGKEVFSKAVSEEYEQIQIWNEYIIMSNESSMAVYNLNGLEKYNGGFETAVQHVKPLSVNRYLLVTPSQLQILQLQQ